MPLYEYECDVCAHRFEVIQKFSDPHVEVCPKCGGHVQKLLSSPAIQFKGSGFYLTDYGRSGSKSDGANVKAGKNESGGSTGGSDSKSSDSGSSSSGSSDTKSSSSEAKSSGSSDSSSKPSSPAKSD
ncbi:MAG: FmdB family zinc ribbon protein [Acidobacteriota bacterium]